MMSAKVAIRAPVSVAHESESSGWREAACGATFRRPDEGALMPTPVIVSATRTAIGTLGGALAQTPATRLGGVVVREAMRRARLEPAQVDEVILDPMVADGLTCPITFVHMGITAENIAAQYGIGREEQDEFAAESQQKTAAAQQGGKFKAEIVPVEIPAKKGETLRFETDEHPRADTTAQRLAALKPAFKKEGGSVTAGNASGINDGAAAVVVMSDRKAQELRLTPLATIRAYAAAGVDPSLMGMGPWPAPENALERAKLRREEIDLW